MKVLPAALVGAALLLLASPFSAALLGLLPECADGVDNDGDASADHPADPDCATPIDSTEAPSDPYLYCPHPSPHAHAYVVGGVGAKSDAVTGGQEVGLGLTTVTEPNVIDCDGDGVAGDFDGDYDLGVGGAFFGYGPWADEPICNHGLRTHGPTVVVNDLVWGMNVWFVIAATDTNGPTVVVDPVTGETTCVTTGLASCVTPPQRGIGTTCGAGGDGGYWVFFDGVFVEEGMNSASVTYGATAGTITA